MGRMNYERWYETISAPFRSEPAAHLVNVADKALVYLIAAVYIIMLAWLAISGDPRLLK